MIDETLMTFEERCTYKLRSLYVKYGYSPYKMGKFEEYELYLRNKDFLVSDRVITFNDTNGKLMALKPDVTLSIIKNGEDAKGLKQKVFYNENVYRVSESTHCFKEIMQTGLECIGDIDIYDIFEVISLAAQSLSNVCPNYCIEISNLDLVGSVIGSVCEDGQFMTEVINCISEKNSHDLKNICDRFDVSREGYLKIASLINVYGERNHVIETLKERFDDPVIEKMALLSDLFDQTDFGDKVKFDFSVVNDMSYYNGFVFKGFVEGVCDGVLGGGQYDNMMRKINRKAGAVGFAIYMDRVDGLNRESEKFDVDCLVLYNESNTPGEVAKTVNELQNQGFSVSAQKGIPDKLKYKKTVDLTLRGELG